jgi:hypothetical protein
MGGGPIYVFTTINDAYAFLLEAKGLPEIKSVRARRQRCVRACILISWAAVEDCLEVAIELWNKKRSTFGPFPAPLKQRLLAVLKTLRKRNINDAKYTRLRRIRNELTHPKPNKAVPDLTVKQAETTFAFCIATIRAIFPYQIELQF